MYRSFLCLLCSIAAVCFPACTHLPPLPAPEAFQAVRYLGKWYEVARLPVFYQPDDTLASAEYFATTSPGVIRVFNQSYDRTGKKLNHIEGSATLAETNPAGRFTVSFAGVPKIFTSFAGPNYHVLYVDPGYQFAAVGMPSRKALWILSRRVPIKPSELEGLIEIARKAGFDTSRLIIPPWPAH